MSLDSSALQHWHTHTHTHTHIQPSRSLPLQGQLLGRMVPRCSDPSLFIRQSAVECIQIVLRIATCMPGGYVCAKHNAHGTWVLIML